MRVVWAGLGAALMIAGGASPAGAADAIRAGKWEFVARVQVPNMPQLPPGVTLPPGVSLPPGVTFGKGGGVEVKRTSCISSTKPIPEDVRPPAEQHGDCKVDKLESKAGSVRWSTSCKTAQGPVHSEGTATYMGDRMEATVKTRAPGSGETSQHLVGHYLGPCDAR